MKAKQCDRCGEFYSKTNEYHMRLARISTTASRYQRQLDLCPKCEADLIKWYEEGKEDD